MIRAFKYRIYPSSAQQKKLLETFELLRELYNAALQERRDAYKKHKISISYNEQAKSLSLIKEGRPEYKGINSQIQQQTLLRLDKAFKAFFRRVKNGEKAGYPRFKGKGQFKTITFPQPDKTGLFLLGKDKQKGKKVEVSNIGKIKVKLHRPIQGTVKQASISLDSDGKWHILYTCDNVQQILLSKTNQAVGVDLGITTFAALSNEEKIENPRFFEKAQKRLKKSQRILAKKKKGSKGRVKARFQVAKIHSEIRRSRLDFHHKEALTLVKRFDRIAIENLNVKGLSQGFLSKQVNDASWGQFISILLCKAESAGKEVIKINPSGTSQECSKCGIITKKDLSIRVHKCSNVYCGYIVDRDVNAAKVIYKRAFN